MWLIRNLNKRVSEKFPLGNLGEMYVSIKASIPAISLKEIYGTPTIITLAKNI